MLANECIIFVLLMVYSATGLGTILRLDVRTSILQKLFIFFCIPLIALVSFFAWIGLYIFSKEVKKKKLTGIFHYFTILPEICEGIVYDIFDFSSEHDHNDYKQPNDPIEYNNTFVNEDTRIVYLSNKHGKNSVDDQYDTDLHEELNFANTKVR